MSLSSNPSRELRLVFLGTPLFAAICLEQLLESRHHVVGVVTAPDRPAGRGQTLRSSEVKKVAIEHNLPLTQPEKLKDKSFHAQLDAWNADLGVVVAFRMLPEAVWNRPRLGTVNLHGSLLPQYRGAAPIHWAVIHGETLTGATTFLLNHEIDTGHVLGQVEVPIGPDDNTGTVHDRILEAGKHLLVKSIDALSDGTAKLIPQDSMLDEDAERREAPKLFKENGRIDWSESASSIHNQIRGLNPFPGAWTSLPSGETIKVHASQRIESEFDGQPGEIHINKSTLHVSCGVGTISLTRIQPQGKPAMDVKDFLNGLRTSIQYFQ